MPLREKQIRRSEDLVTKIITVLETDYLNPFNINMDCEKLLNLSSGVAFQGDVESMLNIWNEGKDLYDQFLSERIFSNKKKFHDHYLEINQLYLEMGWKEMRKKRVQSKDHQGQSKHSWQALFLIMQQRMYCYSVTI